MRATTNNDRFGVGFRISAVGERPAEAARQVSGPPSDPAHGRSWVDS